MGKIYSSQNGVMRGRIGNTVYRKGQRAVIGSQYQPQVSNPKSQLQAIQRAAFSTTMQAQSALRTIVNHSHYGINGTSENVQRFASENAKRIKNMIYSYLNEGTPMWGLLNVYGVKGIQPCNYLISEGTLAFRRASAIDASKVTIPAVDDRDWEDTISTQEDYENFLADFGLLPGDQLSFIGIYWNSEYLINADYVNLSCNVLRSRVTFVDEIPAGFNEAFVVNGAFNPKLIARSEGKIIVDGSNYNYIKFGDGRQGNDDTLCAACVVLSRKDINGKYNYSTTEMIVRSPLPGTSGGNDNPSNGISTYMDGAIDAEFVQRPFLDNPIRKVVAGASAIGTATAEIADEPLPTLLSDDNFVISGLPGEPTDVRITAYQAGELLECANIVGLSSSDNVLTGSGSGSMAVRATLQTAPSMSGEDYAFVLAPANNYSVIVTGGYAIVGGKKFTF